MIGDNGRVGLGNVALGASSAFVYALLSAREVFLERTPLLERLCAALAPWPCAPFAPPALAEAAARRRVAANGASRGTLPRANDTAPAALGVRFSLLVDDFWQAEPLFGRVLRARAGAASVWDVHHDVLARLVLGPPDAPVRRRRRPPHAVAVHLRARPPTVERAADPGGDAAARLAEWRAARRARRRVRAQHARRRPRARARRRSRVRRRARRRAARARGDVEFAAAANASAVEHSRDAGARLDATLADLRGLAAAGVKVLTVVVEREAHGERALTVPSTFAMLAAAWGGRQYHELHVRASGACECRAPAIQRAREPHRRAVRGVDVRAVRGWPRGRGRRQCERRGARLGRGEQRRACTRRRTHINPLRTQLPVHPSRTCICRATVRARSTVAERRRRRPARRPMEASSTGVPTPLPSPETGPSRALHEALREPKSSRSVGARVEAEVTGPARARAGQERGGRSDL